MKINIYGNILAIILAIGSITLATLNNENWIMFLFATIFIFLISSFSKKRK